MSSALATGEGDEVTPGGDPAPGCPGAPPPDRSPPRPPVSGDGSSIVFTPFNSGSEGETS